MSDEARAVDFFNIAHQTFMRARQEAENPVERFYKIGSYTVRLQFAGAALIPFLTPALEHLSALPCPQPDLTLCLWDSASTHTDMPPPPWSWDAYLVRGEVPAYNNDRIRTAYYPERGVLSVLDIEASTGVYWFRDAANIPYYESGSPLLAMLHGWMSAHGRQLVHAGAVGTAQGGVLLVGKGGSGKSTTSLLCITSDLLYASDDYCLITTDREQPYVYSLYNSGKVNADDVQRFPLLAPALSNTSRLSTEKALFFLHRYFPEKIAGGFPIRAVLLPRVTGRPETRLRKVSASAAMLALAPSTIFQLPGAGQPAFQSLGELAKKVPSYVLEVGTDLSAIPDVIKNLLAEY
jgi:hypothetical protein